MRKITFTQDRLALFADYIEQVLRYFNQFRSSTLEKLVELNLQTIAEKLHKKVIELRYRHKLSVSVSFSHAEQITLSYAFKQVGIHPYLMATEAKILEGL